jgi:cytosine/adenosine deaminase-related metal-dependent hydrolase
MVGEPIREGAVEFDEHRIRRVLPTPPPDAVSLGRAAILPGLVNAHTHLELSHLRGRIPASHRFVDWVRPVLAAHRSGAQDRPGAVREAAAAAVAEAHASGTAVVGEVSNTLSTIPALERSGLAAHIFHELIGFSGDGADGAVRKARSALDRATRAGGRIRVSLAPHAPYSVSPALFAAIRRDLDEHAPALSTVHVAESPEEVELLRTGGGEWRALLEELGAWDDRWEAPRCSPVDYLSRMGFLDHDVLAVHGVQLDGADLDRLRTCGAAIVACPRSNRHVGVGPPPLEAFYAMDVAVAFGTDSLASVPNLNLFEDLAEARRIAPRVPARRLLQSATIVAARALGFGDHGAIEPGRSAKLIAVRLPPDVEDVEEYLVSGIEPDAVTWINGGPQEA